MVRLDLTIDLEYQVLQPTEFVFKFHAVETPRQKVGLKHLIIPPNTPFTIESCRNFGNLHLRFHAEPGSLRLQYSALVDISHYLTAPETLREVPVAKLPIDVLQYVYPSRYCPSDRFYQIALQEFGGIPPGYGRVQAIRDWVYNRTRFQPGTTTSFNCAMDTYNDKIGVCRDFAHLMIALCRALNIPARFVTSLDYGADPALGPPDFHAYVEVYLSGRWYIFDPTNICVTTGLVRIATGYDASDVAFATIFGNVMWTVPKVSIFAHDDPAAGITLPSPTTMAVSTSGPREARQTISAARAGNAPPSVVPVSSLLAELPTQGAAA
jgi:transglutaminase-like putative cysteine protease